MGINGSGGNGFPADILAVIEQKNYLQTLIRKGLRPTRVYRPHKIDPQDWFQARVGETKTFTRQGLLGPSIVPLNPANNTGLDNGMTAESRAYEQWTATLNEYANFLPTNILGQEAFLADIFEDNMEVIGQQAGDSIELLCVARAFTAYDSGNTFVTQAITGGTVTSLHVDNINGFNTQYVIANLPSYQTPGATSSTNYVPIAIVAASSGLITYLGNATLATPDVSNTSIMQSGGNAFGVSGVLTVTGITVDVAVGDSVYSLDLGASAAANPPTVGKAFNPIFCDGPNKVLPLNSGVPYLNPYQMPQSAIMNPSAMIPAAVAMLKRRKVPPLSNGLYGCAIDSTLLASFYGDTGFQRATSTNWERSRVFADGIIAAGWGVEFTDHTQLPVYQSPAAGAGFSIRHAQVFGDGVLSEHPFAGARDAADVVAGVGDVADERWVERIKFRSLAALDTLGQVIKVAYDYVGDVQCGTDKASNPTIVLTSDYARYKRGVTLQCAAPY
jgi:hypothetical protein